MMSTDYNLWIEKYTPLIDAIEYLCDIEFFDMRVDSDNDLWLQITSIDKRIVIVHTRLEDDTLISALDIIDNWNLKR